MPYFYPFIILIDSSTPLASRQKPSLAQAFLLGCYVSLTGANLLQGCISHALTPQLLAAPGDPVGIVEVFPQVPWHKELLFPPPHRLSFYSPWVSSTSILGATVILELGKQLQPSTTTSNWPSLLQLPERGLFCFCQGYSGAKDHQRQGMV